MKRGKISTHRVVAATVLLLSCAVSGCCMNNNNAKRATAKTNSTVWFDKDGQAVSKATYYLRKAGIPVLGILKDDVFETHAIVDITAAGSDSNSKCPQKVVFTDEDFLAVEKQVNMNLQLFLALANAKVSPHQQRTILPIGKYDNVTSLWMRTKNGRIPADIADPNTWTPDNLDYYLMLKDTTTTMSPDRGVKTYIIEAFPSSGYVGTSDCVTPCDCERPDATKSGVLVNWSMMAPAPLLGGSSPNPKGETHSGEGPEPSR